MRALDLFSAAPGGWTLARSASLTTVAAIWRGTRRELFQGDQL